MAYEAPDVVHAALSFFFDAVAETLTVRHSSGIDVASIVEPAPGEFSFNLDDPLALGEEAFGHNAFGVAQGTPGPLFCQVVSPDPLNAALRKVQFFDPAGAPFAGDVDAQLTIYQFNNRT
jgi:hypothetical protein